MSRPLRADDGERVTPVTSRARRAREVSPLLYSSARGCQGGAGIFILYSLLYLPVGLKSVGDAGRLTEHGLKVGSLAEAEQAECVGRTGPAQLLQVGDR